MTTKTPQESTPVRALLGEARNLFRSVRPTGEDDDQSDRFLTRHTRDVYHRVADMLAELLDASPRALRQALMRLCDERDPNVLEIGGKESADDELINRLKEILLSISVTFEQIDGPYLRVIELVLSRDDTPVRYLNKTYVGGTQVPHQVSTDRLLTGAAETRFAVYPPAMEV